jgi:hypothetical protein
LKEEALDRTQWRTRFGRGYGPEVRQTTEWMNVSDEPTASIFRVIQEEWLFLNAENLQSARCHIPEGSNFQERLWKLSNNTGNGSACPPHDASHHSR